MENNLEKAKELFFQSLEYQFKGDLKQAKLILEEALVLVPERSSIINNLLVINFSLKDKNSLVKLSKHIDQIGVENEHYSKLAHAYIDFLNKNYENSISNAKSILQKQPTDIEGHCIDLLIKNYFKICDLENLFSYLRLSLKKKINHEQSLYSVGSILQYLSKPRAAIYYINKSLKIRKNDSYNSCLAQSYLKLKNFDKGLELWESRLLVNNTSPEIIKSLRSLKSINDLINKNVLIICEQGLGDTINFSRFVKLLKNYTSQITFTVQDKLYDLLRDFDSVIDVKKKSELSHFDYDFIIPLASLMHLFKIKYNDIKFDHLKIKKEKYPLQLDKNKFNVAFSNSGNIDYINDQFRSINISKLSKIFDNLSVNFFQLSQNINGMYLKKPNIIDASHLNFKEVANFLKDIDLVFTTDTVFVHLCGILKINCIMLLNKNSEWRWFDSKKKTIWYPSIKILKQKRINDWKREINIISKFIEIKYQNK